MDDKNKERTYIISLSYIEDLLSECEEQIENTKYLISEFINNERYPKDNYYLFPISEILFCNLTMVYFVDTSIDLTSPIKNKETGEDEILLSEKTAQLLQSMALSRYYANVSLNKLSYSVSSH